MYQYQPMQLPDFSQAGREVVSGLGALVMMQQARESERRASSEAALDRAERAADREAQLRAQMLEDARLRRQDDRQAFADLMTLRKYERESVVSDLQNIQVLQQMETRKRQEQLEITHQYDISLAMNAGSPAESALAIGRMSSNGILSGLRPELQQQLLTLQSGQHSTPIPIAGEAAIPLSAIDGMLRSSDEDQKARALAVYFSQNGSEQVLDKFYGLSPATIARGRQLAKVTGNHETAKQAGAIQARYKELALARAGMLGVLKNAAAGDSAAQDSVPEAKKQLADIAVLMGGWQTQFEALSGMRLDPDSGSIAEDFGVPAAMRYADGFSNATRMKGVFNQYEQQLSGLLDDVKSNKISKDTFDARVNGLKQNLPNPQAFSAAMDELFVLARQRSSGELDPYSERVAKILGDTSWMNGIATAEAAVGGNPMLVLHEVLGSEFVEAAANNIEYQKNKSDYVSKGELPGPTKRVPKVSRMQARKEFEALDLLISTLSPDQISGVKLARHRFLKDELGMVRKSDGSFSSTTELQADPALYDRLREFHAEARSRLAAPFLDSPEFDNDINGTADDEAQAIASAASAASTNIELAAGNLGFHEPGLIIPATVLKAAYGDPDDRDAAFGLFSLYSASGRPMRAGATAVRMAHTAASFLGNTRPLYTIAFKELGGMTFTQYQMSAWLSDRLWNGTSPGTSKSEMLDIAARLADLIPAFDRQDARYRRGGGPKIDFSLFVRSDPELARRLEELLVLVEAESSDPTNDPTVKALHRIRGDRDFGYGSRVGSSPLSLFLPKSPSPQATEALGAGAGGTGVDTE